MWYGKMPPISMRRPNFEHFPALAWFLKDYFYTFKYRGYCEDSRSPCVKYTIFLFLCGLSSQYVLFVLEQLFRHFSLPRNEVCANIVEICNVQYI